MDNQINLALDSETGHLLMGLGPLRVALAPRDALAVMAGMASLLAQHQQLQLKPEPQILVAGCMPQLSGGIDINGR